MSKHLKYLTCVHYFSKRRREIVKVSIKGCLSRSYYGYVKIALCVT